MEHEQKNLICLEDKIENKVKNKNLVINDIFKRF